MRIGIDVDGILADFEAGWVAKVLNVTGKDVSRVVPRAWDLTEGYGLSSNDVSRTWDAIRHDPAFWQELKPLYKNFDCFDAIRRMTIREEVFFITARIGVRASYQTSLWLAARLGITFPAVIVAYNKGEVAAALALDAFIDDHGYNCLDVKACRPECATYLQDEPYNERYHDTCRQLGVEIVVDLKEALENVIWLSRELVS